MFWEMDPDVQLVDVGRLASKGVDAMVQALAPDTVATNCAVPPDEGSAGGFTLSV
jgi:hypothetical protein